MRVPLSWLAEFVELPKNSTPDSVMAELVKIGLEEEGSHSFEVSGPVVVGEVLEFVDEPQTNGKTIRWCQIRVAQPGAKAADGGADVRGIVCGAHNFKVGDKVVVSLPGAVLPGDFKISARSTYGHTSDGMIASAKELNLSDDHAGIIVLSELGLDPKVGVDALELLHLNEQAAEVNVTPDRGYCFSIRGIAREYSHATGARFSDPVGSIKTVQTSGFKLNVEDAAPIRGRQGCNRFFLQSVTGVNTQTPSPAWMVARLKLAGMRSISLIVDITNYVMLELGQPLHAYDADKLQGAITVRRAKAGETITTLDGQERKLNQEDLVIADDAGAIGIAGVMGGARTEVSESTVNVLIEAANFDPVSIARSARRHKLPSEASKRFERGVDSRVSEFAAARAIELLVKEASGTAGTLGADYSEHHEPENIWLPATFASDLVGVEYSADEIVSILNQIGCVVARVDDGFQVIAPSWRPDLVHKSDLVEEIARISGYDKIPSRLPVAPPGRGLTVVQKQRRAVMNALAGSGHVEVLTYPFVSAEQNKFFNAPKTQTVKLANPLQGEAGEMRAGLLPGLIDAAKRNLSRGLTDLSIFEAGSVFLPKTKVSANPDLPVGNSKPSEATLESLSETVPPQPQHIAGIFTGNRLSQQVGLRSVEANYSDAIHAARIIAKSVGLEISVQQATPIGFHSGRSAEISVQHLGKKVVIGYAGELDPRLATAQDLPRRVAAFELDLDLLLSAAPEVIQATSIQIMPAATQDLSLVVAVDVPAGDLLEAVREGAGELLEKVTLVDDYRGANVPEGQKSLTFALRFRAADRTLTQVEASEARDSAVKLANKKFGATLRT
ncbi:MAG: phenylalanine--tRNA ligase subunit beta [Actinobacteria bacterium]|uniref:Phenylalanine--tRNA ligase beta subunit n=1 Tax=freshwater metagenome TaxID=449393 RepID=A0A6J6CHP1_9ZZZZ|nr:phenylalanine--tRNA ligase subunit beta [Actinomycetota bacterium]